MRGVGMSPPRSYRSGSFTYAEGYHHKYYLTRYAEIREFLEMTYPEAKSLADSTVAMRLNAYLGSGMQRDWERFLAELADFGLPPKIEAGLRETAAKMLGSEAAAARNSTQIRFRFPIPHSA